ncbi:MAG: DNA polymerase III subunit delta [Candidatus Eiseniibacteriota bacterium]|jgi:DNA polymerase-3 subunit delta
MVPPAQRRRGGTAGGGASGGRSGRAGNRGAGAISLATLRQRIEAGRIERLYLCLGEESWLARAAVGTLEAAVVTELNREWGKEEIVASESGAAELLRAATAAPMLGGRQLVVVRGIERLRKQDKELLPRALATVPDSTVLVMTALKLDGRTTFARELKRLATVVDCEPPAPETIPTWIRQRFAIPGRERRVTDDVVRRLHGLAGNDLGALDGEIEKLVQYVGPDREVTRADVDRVVAGGTGATLAELQDALGERDARRGLAALATLLETGHHPLEILAYVGYRIHDLWRAVDTQGRGGGWIRPEVLGQARHHRPQELRRAAAWLFEADRRLKSSGGDPRLVLETLIRKVAATAASGDASSSRRRPRHAAARGDR